MKRETIIVQVSYKITYDTPSLREEAVKQVVKELPIESLTCSREGSYSCKRLKATPHINTRIANLKP